MAPEEPNPLDICDLTQIDDLPAEMQETLAPKDRYSKYRKVFEMAGRPLRVREVWVGLYRLTGQGVSLAAVRTSLFKSTRRGNLRHNGDHTYELAKGWSND